MGRLYTVTFTGVTVSAAQDLFEVTASSTRPLIIHGCEIGQFTEVGDTAEENLRILFRRGTSATTSGSAGSSFTPVPLETNSGAAAFTAEINNTTRMSGGTITTLISSGWNERITPMQWMFPPELRPFVGISERFTVEMASTPADSLDMSGTLWVEEIG